jgi:hypothetical protein
MLFLSEFDNPVHSLAGAPSHIPARGVRRHWTGPRFPDGRIAARRLIVSLAEYGGASSILLL